MVYLRELEEEDIKTINNWRNNKEIIDFLGANFKFINTQTDQNWFNNYQKKRGKEVRCAICLKESDVIIGLISLISIDSVNRNAELHIMIGNKNYHNMGIGKKVLSIMLNHAFNNLNLYNVYLKVLETNIRAIHVYEKIGFVKEGILRERVFKNGKYINLIIMSIFDKEFNYI